MHRFAVATAVATFFLLIAGGLVTSTDSGLAVPDWPLSYGMWFPPMVGGILYEHGHRMIAAVVGLMILILVVWVGRVEPRRWVRRLGYTALAAVILQGLLGGLTVLFLLPPPVSIAHACLGPAVFCLVVCVAKALSPAGVGSGAAARMLRPLSIAVAVLAGAQLLLGALLRHTGYGLSWHIAGAVLLVLSSMVLLVRAHQLAMPLPVRRGVQRLGMLVGLQVGLGVLAWMTREQVGVVTAHVGLGALVLAQTALLAWEI
jgi:cytochrome c oxidase assembly protein subunit 15